jgi:leucyl-tRNA synthetase
VADDIENFSFNTSVSQFMICVNDWLLKAAIPVLFWPLGCRYFPIRTTYRRGIMVVIRKWRLYCNGAFPVFEPKHLIESSKEIPGFFNGKMRFTIDCL